MTKNKSKKPKLVFFIAAFVFCLAITQLVMTHCLATSGEKMKQLEEKARLLQEKGQLLSEEINHLCSLPRIATESQRLGLVKSEAVLNLKPQIPVALENSSAILGR